MLTPPRRRGREKSHSSPPRPETTSACRGGHRAWCRTQTRLFSPPAEMLLVPYSTRGGCSNQFPVQFSRRSLSLVLTNLRRRKRMRRRWPFTQLIACRVHRLALDHAERGIHHQLCESPRRLVQRFGAGTQRLQIVALLQHEQLILQQPDLLAFFIGQQPPRRMARSFFDGGQNRVRFVASLNQLPLGK